MPTPDAAATFWRSVAAAAAICSMRADLPWFSASGSKEASVEEGRDSSFFTSIFGGISTGGSLKCRIRWAGSSPNKGESFDSDVVESAGSRLMDSGKDLLAVGSVSVFTGAG